MVVPVKALKESGAPGQMQAAKGSGCAGTARRRLCAAKQHLSNDLVYETTMLPNILVLFVLPHDEQLWLNVDREHLSIRHCAWWCSLAGLAPTQNSESKRIRIPIEQVFDPSNLIKMMDNLKGGNRP